VLLDGTRWVLYLVLPIHLGMLFFGRPFLERWIGGTQYADWCFPVVVILSATLTIGVAQSVAARILYGMGRLRLFARLALVEAVLNLVLSLVLVGPYGVEGVAVAVAVPNVLFCLFAIGSACFVLDVGLWRYFSTSWLKPLCAVCVPTAVWWHVTPVGAKWTEIALGIGAGLVPFVVVVAAIEFAPRLVILRRSVSTASPQPAIEAPRL
jgi:O-antigen/teichoic acid export membrane protein